MCRAMYVYIKKKNLYCYCRCYQRPFSVNDSCDAKVLGNLLPISKYFLNIIDGNTEAKRAIGAKKRSRFERFIKYSPFN